MALEIKRLTRDELRKTLYDMFWEEEASSTSRWECTTETKSEKSIPRQGMEQRLNNLKVYRERKADYATKVNAKSTSAENKAIYTRAVNLIKQLILMEENGTLENQKKYFQRDHNLFLSRSYLEFPLDKRINALYDDFSGVFLMYENVATLGNNRAAVIESYGSDEESVKAYAENHIKDEKARKEFLSLKTTNERVEWAKNYWGDNHVDLFDAMSHDERIEYLKQNVEVTHVMLGGTESPSIGIAVEGEYSKAFTSFNSKQAILPEEFCDFNVPTLADSLKIQNNDLLQWVQSKIDIDKENLTVVDTKVIGQDEYRLLKTPGPIKVNNSREPINYMIRYVCPSTQRVYHNLINERTLETSEYYKKGDPTSFIYAWWHINNGGEDPCDVEEGGSAIRC